MGCAYALAAPLNLLFSHLVAWTHVQTTTNSRYALPMNLVFDAFWRAAAYCLHPRVIALSLLPLLIMVGLALGVGYFFWDMALTIVNASLQGSNWVTRILGWLDGVGFGQLKSAIAPLLVVIAATPVLVVVSLLAVALMMTPAMVSMVAERRFAKLERKKGNGLFTSILWSLGSTVLAVVAMLASIPLWLIPPLVLVIPPLIWGWLTYRVMSFDALADHATAPERRAVIKAHRMPLLGIGVVCGYLGAAPTLLWASSVMFLVFAPFLVVAAIWIYTLVFAFSSLWFSHYCLAALQKTRADQAVQDAAKPTLAQVTRDATDILPKIDPPALEHDYSADPPKP
jgi:Etoposide-induced protein 2.4 (EI24)